MVSLFLCVKKGKTKPMASNVKFIVDVVVQGKPMASNVYFAMMEE